MHGLIFETSICYWQDQPDILAPRALQSVGPLQEVHSALIVNTNANFPTHTPTLPTWSVLCCGREIHTLTHSSVKQFNCNPIAARQQISFLIQPTLIHIECTSAYPLSRVPWEKYSLSHGKHIQPKGIHTVLAYTTRANTYHRCCCLRSLRGPSLGLPTGRHSQLNGPTDHEMITSQPAVTRPANGPSLGLPTRLRSLDPRPKIRKIFFRISRRFRPNLIDWDEKKILPQNRRLSLFSRQPTKNPKNFFSHFSTFQTISDRLGRKKNFAPKSPTLTFFPGGDSRTSLTTRGRENIHEPEPIYPSDHEMITSQPAVTRPPDSRNSLS